MLKVSFTRSIINPVFPCKMEGYHEKRFCLFQKNEDGLPVDPMRTAYAGRDDLVMDTILIKAGEGKEVIIHVADVVSVEKSFSEEAKRRLAAKYQMKEEQFVITASHTHSSPLVSHGIAGDLHPSEEYHQLMITKMEENTAYCLNHLKDAVVSFDSHEIEGFLANRHGLDQEYFNKILTLNFKDLEGNGIIRMLNIGSHPTVLDNKNKCVSADFFGVIRRYLQGYDGEPTMIVNGEAGDISTRLTKKAGDWPETIRIGEGIAKQIQDPNVPQNLDFDEVVIKEVPFVIDYNPKAEPYLINKKKELEEELKELDPESKEAIMISQCFILDVNEKMEKDRIYFELSSFIYDFGSFRMVTFPSEIDTQLAKKLRYADEKPTYVIAYSNDFHYYAVNKDEYGKCHESYVTDYPFGKADEFVDKIIANYE